MSRNIEITRIYKEEPPVCKIELKGDYGDILTIRSNWDNKFSKSLEGAKKRYKDDHTERLLYLSINDGKMENAIELTLADIIVLFDNIASMIDYIKEDNTFTEAFNTILQGGKK